MSDTHLVVVTDIPFGNAYAYRRGDKIEKSAVERNDWQDYVKSADSKEGRAALGLTEETITASGAKEK